MEIEQGYEDISAAAPYVDLELDGKRALLHMLYVPPSMRGQGKGKALLLETLAGLPKEVEYVRLKSAELGSGCTMKFWQSLGFSKAYLGGEDESTGRVLHLAVNGFALPPVETVPSDEERHYIFD